MRRRRRNKILIWVIGLGLTNFLLYTVIYAYIGGEARYGRIEGGHYFLRGPSLAASTVASNEVSRSVWIYSYAHSVSIWPTIGLVLSSMLILARPHVIATIQDSSVIQGQSFVTAALTTIIILTGAVTLHFFVDFVRALYLIYSGQDYGH